jgi:hypothetical protein
MEFWELFRKPLKDKHSKIPPISAIGRRRRTLACSGALTISRLEAMASSKPNTSLMLSVLANRRRCGDVRNSTRRDRCARPRHTSGAACPQRNSFAAAANVIRLGGVLFVLPALAGRLSGPFPHISGWGDFVTGALAIPVAWLALRETRMGDRLLSGTGRSRPRWPVPLVEPGAVFAHLLALRCRRVALAG